MYINTEPIIIINPPNINDIVVAFEPVGGTTIISVDSGVLNITTSVTTPLFFTSKVIFSLLNLYPSGAMISSKVYVPSFIPLKFYIFNNQQYKKKQQRNNKKWDNNRTVLRSCLNFLEK